MEEDDWRELEWQQQWQWYREVNTSCTFWCRLTLVDLDLRAVEWAYFSSLFVWLGIVNCILCVDCMTWQERHWPMLITKVWARSVGQRSAVTCTALSCCWTAAVTSTTTTTSNAHRCTWPRSTATRNWYALPSVCSWKTLPLYYATQLQHFSIRLWLKLRRSSGKDGHTWVLKRWSTEDAFLHIRENQALGGAVILRYSL